MPNNSPSASPAKPATPTDTATASDAAQPASATKSYTVAKGRSLVIDVTEDGVTAPQAKGPGDAVDLPIAEGKRLIRLGFLLTDDGTQVVSAGGPPTEQGVTITEQA